MNIFSTQGGSQLNSLTRLAFRDEFELQKLIAENPQLLPDFDSDSIVCTEFHTSTGRIDVLVLSRDGDVMVVECKLDNNPEIRRKVLAQAVDYGSAIWKMPIEEFESEWFRRTGTNLNTAYGESYQAIRLKIEENLNEANADVVISVDSMNPELRRMVSYQNATTKENISFVALAIHKYTQGDGFIYAIETIGEVERAEKRVAREKSEWRVEDYREFLKQKAPGVLSTFDSLKVAIEQAGAELVGGSSASENVHVKMLDGSRFLWPMTFYSFASKPTLQINFHYLREHRNRDEFLDILTSNTGLPIDPEVIRNSDFSRKPKINLGEIQGSNIETIGKAIDILLSS